MNKGLRIQFLKLLALKIIRLKKQGRAFALSYKGLFSRGALFRWALCLIGALFVSSCSKTHKQYGASENIRLPSNVEPSAQGFLFDEISNEHGGLHDYIDAELSEEEKDAQTRANSLIPIDYSLGGVAGINMTTEYEEANSILNPDYVTRGLQAYKEGIFIAWREDPPRTPHIILIRNSYQGSIDFGPNTGKRKVGASFAEFFSSGVQDIQKDEKALNFIVSLYRHFEDPDEENCLTAQKCAIHINPEGNYIVLEFPKMVLLFGNNERFQLVQTALRNDDHPGCFAMPFDLLSTQFFCEGSREGPTVSLGESYSAVLEKSGVAPDLPINYTENYIIQLIRSGGIGWKRNSLEEEPPNIPEDSPLSGVRMDTNYNMPFLIGNSLVKISIESDESLALSLDPLPINWSMSDIMQKIEALRESPAFYLAARMPEIKDNYPQQRALITQFLSLLEQRLMLSQLSNGEYDFKIWTRFFGAYNDKYALEPSGVLKIKRAGHWPLSLSIEINSASGNANIGISLINDDFANYIVNSQKSVNLNPQAQSLAGFQLGDLIYLRNKDIGEGTAITAYCDGQAPPLITLAEYSDEEEYGVVYESGRDRNITFSKSEAVVAGGAAFFIHPTGETKQIQGLIYDEYEINSISANGGQFFESVENLCGIPNFNIEMGAYDKTFIESLKSQISAQDRSYPGCPYISPQDGQFSGVKTVWYFPRHQLVLSSADREMFSLRIYKNPSDPAQIKEDQTRRQCP